MKEGQAGANFRYLPSLVILGYWQLRKLFSVSFNFLPNPGKETYIYWVLGGGIGFVHGIVVALGLVIMVAENHPLPKFQKAGFKVAFYHFLAHIIYGVTVGILYICTGLQHF